MNKCTFINPLKDLFTLGTDTIREFFATFGWPLVAVLFVIALLMSIGGHGSTWFKRAVWAALAVVFAATLLAGNLLGGGSC